MRHRNAFYFKACPKCRGDMYLDSDAYGAFQKCLQCGRIVELRADQPCINKRGTPKIAA